MTFQRHRLNKRVITDLKKRSTSGVVFYMLIPPILFFTDSYIIRHTAESILFLGVFSGICLFRLGHVYLCGKMPDRFDTVNHRIFLGSVLLTAVLWGIGSAHFMVKPNEPALNAVMLICTVGFSAGGVMSFMPLRSLAVWYGISMLLPSTVAVFMTGTATTLGLAMILYAAYLVLISLRGSDEYWTALENEHLLEIKTRELEKASRTDGLTGLYNRRYFDELFEREWGLSSRRQTPLTLIICDIDRFKSVNDTYGHQAGDEYLKLVSRHLRSVFQRETDLVARFGGEEFVILLPDRDTDQALPLAERLRVNIDAATLAYKAHTIHTTVSSGIASCIPGPDFNHDRLITRADNALYAAKGAGRNRVVVYTHDMDVSSFPT